jgi:hypothetical protein
MLEAIFILALFPKVVEVRYIPVGIDQRTGDIIMKKDIDYI